MKGQILKITEMQDNTPSRKHAPAVALPQAISTRSGLLDLQVGREGKTGKSRLYTRSKREV